MKAGAGAILPYKSSDDPIVGPTIKDFREFMNYFILYQLNKKQKHIYIICDPKVMEKVFGVKQYKTILGIASADVTDIGATGAAAVGAAMDFRSIYKLPYLNSVTLDVYINEKDYKYKFYYDVENVIQGKDDLSQKNVTINTGAGVVPNEQSVFLDPTNRGFVSHIKDYYHVTQINCTNNL